jgi:hypothetical protein
MRIEFEIDDDLVPFAYRRYFPAKRANIEWKMLDGRMRKIETPMESVEPDPPIGVMQDGVKEKIREHLQGWLYDITHHEIRSRGNAEMKAKNMNRDALDLCGKAGKKIAKGKKGLEINLKRLD